MSDYRQNEVCRVINAGPLEGETWFRLQVSGRETSKHLNVSTGELIAVADIVGRDGVVEPVKPTLSAELLVRIAEYQGQEAELQALYDDAEIPVDYRIADEAAADLGETGRELLDAVLTELGIKVTA